jgi:hypothetical protein
MVLQRLGLQISHPSLLAFGFEMSVMLPPGPRGDHSQRYAIGMWKIRSARVALSNAP